jgi:hypothetical protein
MWLAKRALSPDVILVEEASPLGSLKKKKDQLALAQ